MAEPPLDAAPDAEIAVLSPSRETAERWALWVAPISRHVQIAVEPPEKADQDLWIVDWKHLGPRFSVPRVRADRPAILAVGDEDARPFADDALTETECPSRIVGRARALVRLRRAEVEVERSLDRLRSIKLEQQEVIQFLLHDIKNPLAVVHANLEFLKSFDLGEQSELVDALEDAREASRRIQRMIEDTQLVSRLESRELVPQPKPFALSAALEAAKKGVIREAQRKSLGVELDAPPDLSVHADAMLVRRALDNLIEAALRHTPRGGRIQISARSHPGGAVSVGVCDTGAPLPEPDRARAFDKAGPGRERGRSLGNVGLGFYLCRLIAEAHRGKLELTERPDWPTSFVLWLPPPSR
ncbi:MAG: HAMP domain-containing sensor histidine kinase [Myxococcota bacterium]